MASSSDPSLADPNMTDEALLDFIINAVREKKRELDEGDLRSFFSEQKQQKFLLLQRSLLTAGADLFNLSVDASTEHIALYLENRRIQEERDLSEAQWRERLRKKHYVASVSSAAKSDELREKYRREILPEEPVRGCFVASEMYVRFTIAANRCAQDGDSTEDEEMWRDAVSSITAFGNALSKRAPDSLNYDCKDLENSQSAMVAALLRFAIGRFPSPDTVPAVQVDHQFPVVVFLQEGLDAVHVIGNTNNENKIETNIDVLCYVVTQDEGKLPLCTIEYKADRRDEEQRKAQSDMYATNTMSACSRPCLSIDIAGGRNWHDWEVCASGIVEYDFPEPDGESISPPYRKSVLLKEKGARAFASLAAGLVAAAAHIPNKGDFGELLSPVVGRCGKETKKIFKAYDRATTRLPNVDLVKQFTDKDAVVYRHTSDEETTAGITLVETKELENDWSSKKVSTAAFVAILNQLTLMHGQDMVHGDLRLWNMLSAGRLVDFDYSGLADEKTYPPHFGLIPDGQRHPEVTKHVEHCTVGSLTLKFEHDWFSMAAVMRLFRARETGKNQTLWENAIQKVESGEYNEDVLKSDFALQMNDDT